MLSEVEPIRPTRGYRVHLHNGWLVDLLAEGMWPDIAAGSRVSVFWRGKPRPAQWYSCTTAWPLPPEIIQRLTGTVTTNATPRAKARASQNRGASSAASIAPGTVSMIALTTTSSSAGSAHARPLRTRSAPWDLASSH